MKREQILALCLATFIGIICVNAVYEGNLDIPDGFLGWSEWADDVIVKSLDDSKILEEIAPNFILNMGAGEQDGIFITEKQLIENTSQGDMEVLKANIMGISEFSKNSNISTTLMIIPTAVAIKQSEIPVTADIFNQKEVIERVYAELSGVVGTVDAYSVLFGAREQYTYYRTETNLTGLGGYYLYYAVAPKLGIRARGIDEFEVTHAQTPYYGSLHERSIFKGTTPDVVTMYRSLSKGDEYKVTQYTTNGAKTYYSLFPLHIEEIETAYDMILGGYSPVIEVEIVAPNESTLLIIGDETVKSYLPFLATHYGAVTFIDLSIADISQITAINIDDYNNALFAFSVESMINKGISMDAGFLGALE